MLESPVYCLVQQPVQTCLAYCTHQSPFPFSRPGAWKMTQKQCVVFVKSNKESNLPFPVGAGVRSQVWSQEKAWELYSCTLLGDGIVPCSPAMLGRHSWEGISGTWGQAGQAAASQSSCKAQPRQGGVRSPSCPSSPAAQCGFAPMPRAMSQLSLCSALRHWFSSSMFFE